MKLLQTLVLKLICLALLGVGVLLALYNSSYLYEVVTESLPQTPVITDPLRMAVGVLVALVALFGLLPIRKRRGKSITFPDEQGETTIRLGPIEKALGKEIGRRREVKKLSLHFEPADDKRRVLVEATAVLKKAPDVATREVYRTMKAIILQEARNMLGTDTVIGVNLDIEGIVPGKGKRSGRGVEEAPLTLAESPESHKEDDRSPFDETAPEEDTGQTDEFESGYQLSETTPTDTAPESPEEARDPDGDDSRLAYSYLPDEPEQTGTDRADTGQDGDAPPMIELDDESDRHDADTHPEHESEDDRRA